MRVAMNEPVVIKMPTNAAIRFIAKGIAIVVLGTLLGIVTASGDKSDYDTFQALSAEERQLKMERHERRLENAAKSNASETILLTIFAAFLFCGAYEFVAFLAAIAADKLVHVSKGESEADTTARSDSRDRTGRRWQ
jgi:hypothetical protein